MSNSVFCRSLKVYLQHVTREIGKHGKVTDVEYRRLLAFGFSSPDGEWLVGMNVLKGAFPCAPRRNTEVERYYKEAGGTTPIVTVTTCAPNEVVVRGYIELLQEAVAEGERIYQLRQKN